MHLWSYSAAWLLKVYLHHILASGSSIACLLLCAIDYALIQVSLNVLAAFATIYSYPSDNLSDMIKTVILSLLSSFKDPYMQRPSLKFPQQRPGYSRNIDNDTPSWHKELTCYGWWMALCLVIYSRNRRGMFGAKAPCKYFCLDKTIPSHYYIWFRVQNELFFSLGLILPYVLIGEGIILFPNET